MSPCRVGGFAWHSTTRPGVNAPHNTNAGICAIILAMKARKTTQAAWLPDIALLPAPIWEVGDEEREELRGLLLSQKLPQLRAIAAARGLAVRGSQREALVTALVESLSDPAQQ